MTQRDGRDRPREKEPKKEMGGGGKRDEGSERWNKRTKDGERWSRQAERKKELTKKKEGGGGERGRDDDKWTTKRYIRTAEEE